MRQPRAAVRGLLLAVVLLMVSPPNNQLQADPIQRTTQKGPVRATAQLEPPDPLIGDPVELTLRVVAEKGVELIMPEFGEALGHFGILDFNSEEQIDGEGQTIATQRYQLQPRRSGKHSIPPIMIEFVDRRPGAQPAPKGLDAYELLTERLAFEVGSVLLDQADAELSPPLGQLPLRQQDHRRAWLWLLLLAALVVAAVFAWQAWRSTRRRARQRSAYEIAHTRLIHLLNGPRNNPEQIERFFVGLSDIVRRYLEDRFDLRAPELTTEEFLAQMSHSPEMSSEHQTLLRDFLRRADLVKFAKFLPSDQDIDDSIAAARRFLAETRQNPTQAAAPGRPLDTARRLAAKSRRGEVTGV